MRVAVFGRSWKTTLLRLVIWVILCLVVFRLLLIHVRVDGISMLPTCADKSTYWVNRLAYLRQEPQRGDVVAVRLVEPDGAISRLETPRVMLLKRIVGLPGETVAFVNGKILINGEMLDEPYEKSACDWNIPPVQLAADEYFVVGDNRTMPVKDHTKGVYKRSQIIGRARL